MVSMGDSCLVVVSMPVGWFEWIIDVLSSFFNATGEILSGLETVSNTAASVASSSDFFKFAVVYESWAFATVQLSSLNIAVS